MEDGIEEDDSSETVFLNSNTVTNNFCIHEKSRPCRYGTHACL
jgi:hypothetical protein